MLRASNRRNVGEGQGKEAFLKPRRIWWPKERLTEEVGLTSGNIGQGEAEKNLEVEVQEGPAQSVLRPAQTAQCI